MREEALAMLLVDALDAIDLEHIDADPVDHRAARINSFMSRTALAKPSTMARATIACPILSSTISGMAAIGSALGEFMAWPAFTIRPRRAANFAAAHSRSNSRARAAPIESA